MRKGKRGIVCDGGGGGHCWRSTDDEDTDDRRRDPGGSHGDQGEKLDKHEILLWDGSVLRMWTHG